MGETKQLAVLVIAGLIIGIIGLFLVATAPAGFQGDLVVTSYEAILYENGTLTEQYTYDVRTSGEYRMLFRTWEAPLIFGTPAQPSVVMVSAAPPAGTIAYVKDYSGNVVTFGDSGGQSYESLIGSLANPKEVGIFNPGRFSAGQYTVSYTYVVHPPIEFDPATTHLNLKLAGRTHIPYQNVRITVPARDVQKISAYPPELNTGKTGETYVITGRAAANENVAVEILAGPDGFSRIPGFRNGVPDLTGKMSSGSFWYNATYTLSYLLGYLAKAAVVLVPLLLIVIYSRYGREKKFTVPEYLSTIPNPELKPWQANLLFKGDEMDFDECGYYATLLDLHRRKFIVIALKGEGEERIFDIRILKVTSDDPYEQRVLNVLGQIAQNGVIDTSRIATLAREAQSSSVAEERALRYQKMLADVTKRADANLVGRYIVDGRDHLLPLLLASITAFAVTLIFALVFPMQSSILFPAVVLWGVVFVQTVIAIVAPSTLFGHWKDDKYKEKLEWDAFTRFLSDQVMIRKYAPEALSMWGEWLVYGTALGVGENVKRAMESLKISVPDTGGPMGVMEINNALTPLLFFTPPTHGDSGSSWGFGGGDFGGGGGGAGGR